MAQIQEHFRHGQLGKKNTDMNSNVTYIFCKSEVFCEGKKMHGGMHQNAILRGNDQSGREQ